VNRPRGRAIVIAIGMACLSPLSAGAQTNRDAPAVASAPSAEQSRLWIVAGGGSTTVQGDCRDCSHESPYRHTGGLLVDAGVRVNDRMDGGAEVFWVPGTSKDGDRNRVGFLMGVAQFRPWGSSGFFLKGGMGFAWVRNWIYEIGEGPPPYTSKALGLTYGAGWAFRRAARVGLQVHGSQHVIALGDIETSAGRYENIVGNMWSIGAAVVIR
jgi:hypothetical protein